MDCLQRLSIDISIAEGLKPKDCLFKGMNAELAAFKTQSVQILVLYSPTHSFVVIRSQHPQWQK